VADACYTYIVYYLNTRAFRIRRDSTIRYDFYRALIAR